MNIRLCPIRHLAHIPRRDNEVGQDITLICSPLTYKLLNGKLDGYELSPDSHCKDYYQARFNLFRFWVKRSKFGIVYAIYNEDVTLILVKDIYEKTA